MNHCDRAKVRDFHSGWTLSAGTPSTFIAPLPCRNNDFRSRAVPAGVAIRRSNHLK